MRLRAAIQLLAFAGDVPKTEPRVDVASGSTLFAWCAHRQIDPRTLTPEQCSDFLASLPPARRPSAQLLLERLARTPEADR